MWPQNSLQYSDYYKVWNKLELRDQNVALAFHYTQPISQRTMIQQTSKA